jgi:inositol transport system substrate-binding protein
MMIWDKDFFKWFLTASIIFYLLFLSACGKKAKDEKIKIGVSIANFEDVYLSHLKSEMEKYQESLGEKVEVTYLDAKVDVDKQEGQVSYFIEEGVDVLVVIPVNGEFTENMSKMAKESRIPLVYANSYPDEFREKELPSDIFYVGSKEKNAGIIQMEYLAEKLGGKGDVAILMGDFINRAAYERTEGVEEAASEYPEINIVTKASAKWRGPLAGSIVENWLNSGEKIDAIAANNDEMALGAIYALEKYGRSDVMVLGVDATSEAIEKLKSGSLAATVLQDPYKHAKEILDTALKAAKGERLESEIWIPFELVTPENYKEILEE